MENFLCRDTAISPASKLWFLTGGPWGSVNRFQGVRELGWDGWMDGGMDGLRKKLTYYRITYSLFFIILKPVFEHNWFPL
jgi:hypothetical protein